MKERKRKITDNTNIINGTDQTVANQATVERTEKQIQNPDPIGQRNRPIKNQPQNVVGADIGISRPDISEEIRRND